MSAAAAVPVSMSNIHPIENIVPFRTRSWDFYLVFVLTVLPVVGSSILSWIYAIWAIFTGHIWHLGPLQKPLFFLSLAEVAFTLYQLTLIFRVNKPSCSMPPGDMHELQKVFQRVLKTGLAYREVDEETLDNLDRPGSPEEDIVQLEHSDPRAVDFRNSLRTWFGKSAWSSVRLEVVQKWLYWAMFNEHLPSDEDMPHARRIFLDEAVELLEKRCGCKIPDGPCDISPMLLTLDQVNIVPRPLWWYATIGLINVFCRHYFETYLGAHHGHRNGLEYLLRVPEDWNSSGPRPIVFIHGLGLGLFQYTSFLLNLLDNIQDRPILIVLQPHISQNFFHPRFLEPPGRRDMGRLLVDLFSHLGWVEPQAVDEELMEEQEIEKSLLSTGVDVVSHSNGSYAHAWLCKDYPSIIHRSAFVDATCFVLSEGDVCYNFLYRPCKTSIELIMRFFVGTELGVANLLHRNFQWSDNNLWFEEIPNARDPARSLFVVGGKDDIVNSERVRKYLTSHGIKKGLWYDPDARHGQALIGGGQTFNDIVEWLRQD